MLHLPYISIDIKSKRLLSFIKFNDPTSLLREIEELKQVNLRDSLTCCYSRKYLYEYSDKLYRTCIFIDCDNFKLINDRYSYLVGDKTLISIGLIIDSFLDKEREIAIRYGGDEFIIFSVDNIPSNRIQELSNAINNIELQEPLEFIKTETKEEALKNVSVSIGVYKSEVLHEWSLLINNTEICAKKAKKTKNCIFYWDSQVEKEQERIRYIDRLLHKEPNITVEYQPIINIEKESIEAVEVLARYYLEDGSSIPPSEFIPVAERNGLIKSITSIIFTQGCKDFYSTDLYKTEIKLHFNICSFLLEDVNYIQSLVDIASTHLIDSDKLVFEVTENSIFEYKKYQRTFEIFNNLNIVSSLDDFGTGNSNISMLSDIYKLRKPFTGIKVDKSFIPTRPDDRFNMGICLAITNMVNNWMSLCAEGVETIEQAVFLHNLNYPLIQGWLFSPSLSKEQLIRYTETKSYLDIIKSIKNKRCVNDISCGSNLLCLKRALM